MISKQYGDIVGQNKSKESLERIPIQVSRCYKGDREGDVHLSMIFQVEAIQSMKSSNYIKKKKVIFKVANMNIRKWRTYNVDAQKLIIEVEYSISKNHTHDPRRRMKNVSEGEFR